MIATEPWCPTTLLAMAAFLRGCRICKRSFDVISINSSTTPLSTLSSWWMEEDSHWREESIEFNAGLI
jgi:hypothetical protein